MQREFACAHLLIYSMDLESTRRVRGAINAEPVFRTVRVYSKTSNKRLGENMKRLFFMFMIFPSLSFAWSYGPEPHSYTMNGVIVGYMSSEDSGQCFLAIRDDADKLHSFGYHKATSKPICELAKVMHMLRMPVTMSSVDDGYNNSPHPVRELASVSDSKVFWPSDHGGYGSYKQD